MTVALRARVFLTSFVAGALLVVAGCQRGNAPQQPSPEQATADISAFIKDMNSTVIKLDQVAFTSYFAPNNIHVFNGVRSVGPAGLEHRSWISLASVTIEEIGTPDITVINP